MPNLIFDIYNNFPQKLKLKENEISTKNVKISLKQTEKKKLN